MRRRQDRFFKKVVLLHIMNRRSFIKKTVGLVLGLSLISLPELASWAAAATKWGRTRFRIQENDFWFAEEPERRAQTNRIIVHHTGTGTDRDMSAAEIHRLHRDSFGWAGIGYHYVIRKNGTIERGRGWNMVGAHASGNNGDSVGICVAGNFDVGSPTEAQIRSLTNLLTALCGMYNLIPDEMGVMGHRDVNATSCPGNMLYAMLPQVRRRVMKNMGLNLPEDE